MKKLAYVWIYLATLIFHFSMLVSCCNDQGYFVGVFLFIVLATGLFLKTSKYENYLPSAKFIGIYGSTMIIVTITVFSQGVLAVQALMLLMVLDVILLMIKMSRFNSNL